MTYWRLSQLSNKQLECLTVLWGEHRTPVIPPVGRLPIKACELQGNQPQDSNKIIMTILMSYTQKSFLKSHTHKKESDNGWLQEM